ncbi:MAG: tyrosine-type recombinase/integrase [Clostridia bacterium]|nr:tyrosine-type recombinase/integrase [Clostridia bacterium]
MIRERGKGIYEITVDNGRDLVGKRIRINKRFHGNKKEARAFEAELKAQIKQGNYVVNNSETVKSYFEKWLKEYVRPNLKPKSYESYSAICHELLSQLGHVKLNSLSALMLVGHYNYLRDRGNVQKSSLKKHKRLTENTVLRHYRVINVALKQAVDWQLLAHNPNERVKAPKKLKVESKFYDLEQTQCLLKALDGEHIKYQAIIRLALDTGCRRAELIGLEWSDINFTTGMVSINKTLQRINGQLIDGTPKNNNSIRSVPISDPTIEVLKEYQTYINNIKDAMGNKWKNTKKIFTTDDGDPIHPDTPRKIFEQILKKHNLPIITFHSLRHTSASLQISRGISVANISRRLGHGDISTTLNVYSHAFNSGNEKIIREFNNIFNTKEG